MKKNKILSYLKIQVYLILLIILGIGVFVGSKIGKDILDIRDQAMIKVSKATEETFRETLTSVVYDRNGVLISTMKTEKDVFYLSFNEIPEAVIEAFIAMEDRRFYDHKGVDYFAIVRAGISIINSKTITQGGSTITQQLSRNVFLTHEVTIDRKIEEAFIARELEDKFSKEQILEFYINNIYFSNGYYGIQAASKGFFDIDIDELSLSQTAFLCAIPNNPSTYDPLINIEATLQRRDLILNAMIEEGFIDKTAYKEALREEIVLNRKISQKNDYVETYVYYCATRELMKQKGFKIKYYFISKKEQDAYNEAYSALYQDSLRDLYTGGYTIHTSIDLEMQEQLQKIVDQKLSEFDEVNEEGIFMLQGAAVSIDNESGKVIAIVGGRNQKLPGYTLNRGFQSYRQPGSVIKPLLIYTPIFQGDYIPETIVLDEKKKNGPSNSNRIYSGEITVRRAVKTSKNTIAWEILNEKLTPSIGLEYLKKLNFAKIVDLDYVPAVALGGMTYGASTLEMTAGFATLENSGIYRDPTCIKSIIKADKIFIEVKTEEKVIYK
ncbi:MAG: glycosyl transferase, partial [Clostridiales bacterium]|nr:glycosyl transferase [Clostridiales bacterium]